jgi:hypothetical protein
VISSGRATIDAVACTPRPSADNLPSSPAVGAGCHRHQGHGPRCLTRPGEDPAPSADTSCTPVSATLRMSKLLASLMMTWSRASSTSAPEHQLTVINGTMLTADYEEKPVTRNLFPGSGKSSWLIRNLAAHRPARYQPRRSIGKASIRPPRRRSTGERFVIGHRRVDVRRDQPDTVADAPGRCQRRVLLYLWPA